MTFNIAKLLPELKKIKKNDRTKISLYISKSAYEEFKEACGVVSAAKVVEYFIIEAAREAKKR